MINSFAAPHARGKFAQDKIFGANAACQARIAEIGAEKVTNGTIGSIMDNEGKLVCLPTVEKVYRNLPTNELIQYAPISGLPDFLEKAVVAAFGKFRPNAFIGAVATAGGTGGIHHAIWNYTREGDTVITADWYWGAYKVLCQDLLRKLDTYKMLTDDGKFNLPALEEKCSAVLAKQEELLLIINTPAHNPTGYSLDEQDISNVLAMLGRVGAGKKVTLFLDVAYIDYAGDKDEVRKVFRVLEKMPENVFCIVGYSMSKGFTMYGQRTGAMIGVSPVEEVITEFKNINQYTSRATWSNINRPSMKTLSIIYSDPELLHKVEEERDFYYKMIKERADLFVKEARECGLPMIPYVAGFFLSIPAKDSDAVCNKLHDDNIFIVPLAAGVRVALCSVPLQKIGGMAAKIKAAMIACGEIKE